MFVQVPSFFFPTIVQMKSLRGGARLRPRLHRNLARAAVSSIKKSRQSSRRKSNRRKSSSSRRKSSLSSLEKRLEKLFSGKRRKTPRLSSKWKKRKGKIAFPPVPTRSIRRKPLTKGERCCRKISEMRRKYKEGQRIINEVDKFMGRD